MAPLIFALLQSVAASRLQKMGRSRAGVFLRFIKGIPPHRQVLKGHGKDTLFDEQIVIVLSFLEFKRILATGV